MNKNFFKHNMKHLFGNLRQYSVK